MVELGTRCTTERVQVGNSPPKAARTVFLPDKGHLPAETGDNLQRLIVIGTTEDGERNLVWRMGQYER